ncbi:DUF7577 domain-containing protein [Halobaculum litoreum]|uniref:DUF7577 domain-containing protein n=1 Tax=Halobaculum litoreum TaxID=3031998 RepID=A0ABD5XPN9_9EURY|nr:hypothetical protein [Halobaculum sp. DT92]
MVEVTFLAVIVALFALQVALVVYAGVRRDGGDGHGVSDGPDAAPASTPESTAGAADGRVRRGPGADRSGTVRCHSCDAANDDTFRFCRNCVERLPAGGYGASAADAARGSAR